MSKAVDELIQDANVRLTIVKKYQTELANAGIGAEYITLFETKIAELRAHDTAFNEAKNRKLELTDSQKMKIKASQDVIKKFKAAAQIAFYGDKTILKEFRIGLIIPGTVKQLSSELSYLKEIAGRYAEQLQAGGISATDITALEISANELVAIDQQQEESKNAQRTQKTAVDTAIKALKEMMFKINKAAAIVFMHDKAKLAEFKSIFPKAKTKSTASEPTATGT